MGIKVFHEMFTIAGRGHYKIYDEILVKKRQIRRMEENLGR